MNLDTNKIWAILRIISPITLALISATLTYNAFFRPFSEITPLLIKLGAVSLTVLTAYITATVLDITDYLKRGATLNSNIDVKLTSMETALSRVDREIHNINKTTTEKIETFSRFYDVLQDCRSRAVKRLQLTQLDPHPPSSYGDPNRDNYFDVNTFVEYALKHPDIKIQRVISIQTMEKLTWVRELIEATKEINNIYLAYIRLETDIRKSWPTPPVLSLQIIDEAEMLLDNPQYSYMPHRFAPCLYLRDSNTVKIFSDYYDDLWKSIEKDDTFQRGIVLKDGLDVFGYEEKMKLIEEYIQADKPA